MSKGYVYILTNPSIREVDYTDEKGKITKVLPVKIGIAKDVEKRLGTLNTSLPDNFIHHLSMYCEDAKAAENVLHRYLRQYRILASDGGKTEFFACPIAVAVAELRQVQKDLHLKEYHLRKDKLHWRSASKNKSNLKAMQNAKKAQMKQSLYVAAKCHATPFQFAMLAEAGIKIGSELEFVYGGQKVKVADLKNKIEFEGETYTTTRFCKKFMPDERRNSKDAYQGPKYFTFKGEQLTYLRAKMGK